MANEAYHTSEYFHQQRKMLLEGDPRALVCFCIDISTSMDEWWIEEGGLIRTNGTGAGDGHNVFYFNPDRDVRRGYEKYRKMDKLNEVLKSLLLDFKYDQEINNKVAVSIVTYSRFGRVQYDFLDCADLEVDDCRCRADKPETSMGEGLRTAIMQIDEMKADMHNVGKDSYTPILIFMSDGSPTDDPRQEFAQIRDRVEKGELHVFPLGIGDGADMFYMRNLFPTGHCPDGFTSRYKMVKPKDYEEIFREIKTYVVQRQCVMVSEGDSVQSAPAIEDEHVINNQLGETWDFEDLINVAFN